MSEYEFLENLFGDIGMVLLYFTVAVVAVALILGALIYFFKKDRMNTYKKSVAGFFLGYAVIVAVIMTYIKIKSNAVNPDIDGDLLNLYLFKPILSIILIAVGGALLMLTASFFSKKAMKYAAFAVLLAEIGAFIATMVFISRYYREADVAAWMPSVNTVGLIVSAVIIMVLIAGFFIIGNSTKNQNNTRALVYGALSVAMSFALSYIKLFEMPQGGSITFASLLPLIIYSCMFGTRRGIVACLIYGVLQAVQDPWIIHPMQFLLDYPLAFGLVGISGIFMEKGLFKNHKIVAFLLGALMGVTLRFVCHVISGVFAFADWAKLDIYGNVLAYSLAYNSFAFIDLAITLAAGSFLFASKAFNAQMAQSMGGASLFGKRKGAVQSTSDGNLIAGGESVEEENDDANDGAVENTKFVEDGNRGGFDTELTSPAEEKEAESGGLNKNANS
jgi:thiamine transporter